MTDDNRDWPHVTNYASYCYNCKCFFHGPKRAPACWECVNPETKIWWHSLDHDNGMF